MVIREGEVDELERVGVWEVKVVRVVRVGKRVVGGGVVGWMME